MRRYSLDIFRSTGSVLHKRFLWTLQVCAGIFLFSAAISHAADLSIISDFATSEIQKESALLKQVGDHNLTTVDQTETVPGNTGNYTEVTQIGASNKAFSVQNGDVNRARVNQNGSENFSSTNQNGSGNLIDLVQIGAGNNFVATQTGNDNGIVYEQLGGTQATLNETGNANSILWKQLPGSLPVNINLVGDGLSVKSE